MRPILIALPVLLLAGCGGGDQPSEDPSPALEPGLFAATSGRGIRDDPDRVLAADMGAHTGATD